MAFVARKFWINVITHIIFIEIFRVPAGPSASVSPKISAQEKLLGENICLFLRDKLQMQYHVIWVMYYLDHLNEIFLKRLSCGICKFACRQ